MNLRSLVRPPGTHSKGQAAKWRIVAESGRDLHTSTVKVGKECSGNMNVE